MTSRWFRQVGNGLGMSDGAERLHYLLELDPDSPMFRHDLAAALPFGGRNPLYAAVHEACYADGVTHPVVGRARAARRVPRGPDAVHRRARVPVVAHRRQRARARWPRRPTCSRRTSGRGSTTRTRCRSCDVPAAAAIYAEDAYVDRAFSEETAALVPTLRPWVTNEYEHNGLRADGGRILDRLFGLAQGRL